ncbi:cerevisin [[Candida] jaroonii]|uniref:Cerevisin n=1 Tax=[Candida] jaroonii TaxID=467808 RepID=A0ACA9YDP7_9ASCO|nr:cerevisin [[Candida] jaroonii]
MLLSKSVALSILATLGVQGLVIPSVNDVVDVFGSNVETLKDSAKAELNSLKGSFTEASVKILDKLEIKLLEIEQSAPLFGVQKDRDLIPDKYIVVFKDDVAENEMSFHKEWVTLQHVESIQSVDEGHEFFMSTKDHKIQGGITDAFKIDSLMGYSGFFMKDTIDLIRRHPSVKFVEQDSMVYASEFETQKDAPWGLARVSHRQPLSLNSFNQYLYDTEGGEGVTAYVIDTGVNVDHEEFGGRAVWGSTVPYGDADIDGNGHGTHCAGTIGSASYGVAKKADIVAVKVLRSNGSGSMSDVVKGVEFAAKSHQDAAKKGKKGFKGSTANMSLGGGKSTALDLAVNAAVKAGLNFAVAAGNENQDACNTSPAAAENAITVGASTISDSRAYFSNYGKCVDIFAPGLNILSTYIGSNTATATLSGTSMASPHICGLLSYFVSLQPSADSEFFTAANSVTPEQLKKNLIAYGSKDLLSDIPEDTPNILAFNGAGHNITDFWGTEIETTKVSESKLAQKFHELENKVDALLDSDVLHDIESMVNKVYQDL